MPNNLRHTKKKSGIPKIKDEMRAEYEFDYARSRPNRFASRMKQDAVTIVLEPDVAQVLRPQSR